MTARLAFHPTPLAGLMVIEREPIADERGLSGTFVLCRRIRNPKNSTADHAGKPHRNQSQRHSPGDAFPVSTPRRGKARVVPCGQGVRCCH